MIKLRDNLKIALGVSGGVDSMVMLDIVSKLPYKLDLCVVTVNHNLRPTSTAECQFVAAACKKYNIPCHIESIDVNSYATAHKVGCEAAARTLRYLVFDKYLADYDYIATAHHLNDNVETVLMHIFRGCGINGLIGMTDTDKYYRPLLNMTRQQILDYAKDNDIKYVTDETNSLSCYTRNFVRNQALPLIQTRYSDVVGAIATLSDNAKQLVDFIDSVTPFNKVTYTQTTAFIPDNLNVHSYILNNLIIKAFNTLGKYAEIYQVNVNDVAALFTKKVGSMVMLDGGFIARRQYDGVTIINNPLPQAKPDFWQADLKIETICSPFGKIFLTLSSKAVYTKSSLNIDWDKLPSNCVVRTRLQGDIFNKFGGVGSKKLKDYLIDIKYPQELRDQLLLIACNNNILAIVGVEISDSVKIDDNTKNILQIDFTKETL